MPGINISTRHIEEITRHCLEVFPNEACGLLAGNDLSISRSFKMKNVEHSSTTYELDPDEQMNAMREIKAEGLQLLGIYHSHTSSAAYPSPIDVMRAFFPGTVEENYPGVAYVIADVTGGEFHELKAFHIKTSSVTEIQIDTTGE